MEASPANNPYEPPVADTDAVRLPVLAWRARMSRRLLLLSTAASALTLLIVFGTSSRVWMPTSEHPQVRVANTLLGIAFVIIHCSAATMFCVWLHAAYKRSRSEVTNGPFSPALSVVSWFIPIVNLWLPLVVMRRLWQMSRAGVDWQQQAVPFYMAIWWPCAVLPWITSPLAELWRLGFGQELNFFWGVSVSCVCMAISTWLTSRLVRDITAMQRERLGVD
jgi:hypothetical protein